MSRPDKRAGFTLFELLAVMSIGSVLMLLAVAWIGETIKFTSRTNNHRRQHQQLTRLGWNLRTDVRLSQSMAIDNERRLVLQGNDGHRIFYSISGTTIEMEKSGGSQVSRERYRLAAGSLIEWDISGMPDSIGLIVSRSPYGTTAKAEPDMSGSNNRNINNPVEPKTIPIDIHIFAHANRWEIQYSTENTDGGAP